ncbi:oligoendopeptidase F [Fusobacterium sp. SB021]|uniref:oligoendopeptidase F n=1 Tax=Fusobacterium sp. SB021 TaxID=2744227 RepID=UPI003CE8F929
MKSRNEIDKKYKWNTEDIYKDWNEWQKDVKKMKELMKEIPQYENKIENSREDFVKLIKLEESLSRILEKVYLYPYMLKDLDSTDQLVSQKLQEIEFLYAQFSVATSWISPKILEIPKETLEKWIDENDEIKDHKFNLMELYRLKAHVLDKDKEKLLSHFSQYMGAVNDIYDELSTSDIKWNEITLSTGEKVLVTNGMYSKILDGNKNQDDRRKAFEALYSSYDINKNTYSAIYKGILQRDAAGTKAKNYNSTVEKALEPNNIPVKVYENLINSAKENSGPLKKYVEFRKKQLGLDSYHYYDNQIKLADYTREFSYEEAKEIVLKSVEPLGEDYTKNLEKAVGEGWLDVYETPNKRSGAYSLNIYDVHPYMLLNYNGTMDAVFTLAHELGHTLHSMYSTKYQPYATNDYTIFVAEVASTFNERLLLDYMLKNTTDHKEKIALIEEAIGNIMGTYYIQALFAAYEYEAHKLTEEGNPITPDVLSEIMAKLFAEYFGDSLVMDELQKIIWARIPHFFNSPYYVYQYATSFAASSRLYEKVTNEKYSPEEREEARKKYIELLKSGGNNYPIEQLKLAGVNLEEKENFEAVAHEMTRLIGLLEKELKELK